MWRRARTAAWISISINRNNKAEEIICSTGNYEVFAIRTGRILSEVNLATCQNNLGVFYNGIHRFQEAEEMYKAALATRKALAAKDPDTYLQYVAISQNNLGLLYIAIRRFQEAEEMLREALKTRTVFAKQNPSAYLPEVAESQNNLGYLYHSIHRFQEAEEMYRAALEIRSGIAKQNQ